MASIEDAAERREPARIASSVAPLIVARSPRVASLGSPESPAFLQTIPAIRDARVSAPPVVCEPKLRRLLRMLDHLEFPSFDDRQAAELLRLHLLFRLASSPAACVETLRRHRAYLDRAVAAARTGEHLSRRSSRQLFGADEDVQLLLEGLEPATSRAPIDVRRLQAERGRVSAALHLVRRGSVRNPKAELLERLVHQRRRSKTIVFTGAVATALDLARRLQWQSVAVVSGRGARIASGALPVGEALGLFAPYARGAAPPPRCAPVDVLLATDLASEGLDLHDADAIVHFDLPWTPLRLLQRTGRVARLGSRHEVVHVWWFLPAATLERRMQLGSRIDRKARRQRDLGVPVSSTVARGQLVGRAFERRERLAAWCRPPSRRSRCFAVVTGPPAAAFACRWHFRDHSVPELLVLAGTPPRWVSDLGAACALAQRLLRCPASHRAPWGEALTALHELLRSRLADTTRGPANLGTRCLARSLVRLAVREGAGRRADRIALLDAVLQRLNSGVPVGGERALTDVLSGRGVWSGLQRWLRHWPGHSRETPSVTLEGAIFGDGTVGAA